MTEFEKNCYGMTETAIREQYMDSITAKLSGLEMVVMGMLSDSQEMLEAGYFSKDDIRQQLNKAKFILSEMMDAKRG
jgi:NADH pyrophosphatase NudC (nudix superfamily)